MDAKASSAVSLCWQEPGWCGSPPAQSVPWPLGFLWKHTHDTCMRAHTHMHPPTWTEITRLHENASQVLVNRHWAGQLQQALFGLFSRQYLPIYPWHREGLPTMKAHSTLRAQKWVFLLLSNYKTCRLNRREKVVLISVSPLLFVDLVWPHTVQAVCFMRTCLT